MLLAIAPALRLLSIPMLAAGAMGASPADAAVTLKAAVATTIALTSYHISAASADSASAFEGDVVNPGRLHFTTAGSDVIAIGPTLYLKKNGAWQKLPSSGPVSNSVADLAARFGASSGTTVVDGGVRIVDGRPLHEYRARSERGPGTAALYVNSAGRLARIDVAGLIVRFTRFDAPISIRAPLP